MLFAFAFVATGMTPAQAHANCAATDIQGPPVVFHGTVTDPLGPLRGATVYAKYHGEVHWTTTGTDGTYEILGRSDCAITIWVEHVTHAKSAERHFDTPIVEQAVPVDFQLKYLAETWVTPSAFKTSPQALTYFVKTTAPDTGVRVPVVLPSGDPLELTLDTTAQPPTGWKQWIGTTTVSPTSDARFNYQACVLFQNATGNCNTAGAAALVSQIATSSYAFDRAPPILSTSTPAPFADVLSVSGVTLTWAEPLAGLDPSGGHSIKVDGVTRPSNVSGNLQTASVTGLTPGIHLVEAQIRDLAGNATSTRFIFTLVQITAEPATAALRSVTVPVNPSSAIPPPSSVRFSQPKVDTSAFSESINATTRVGYGDLQRAFSLGTVQIVFNNESGIPSAPQTVSVPSAAARHQVATLAPSSSQLSATIPAKTMTIGDIVVSVPAGYNTPGSTATLLAKTVVMGSTTPVGAVQSLLENALSGQYEISGRIPVCREEHPNGMSAFCQADNVIGVQVAPPGLQPIPVFVRGTNWGDQSLEASTAPDCPDCINGTATDEFHAGLILGCSDYQVPGTTSTVNLCDPDAPNAGQTDGYLASYLNGWILEVARAGSGAGFPVWRQDHVVASPAGDRCPHGRSPSNRVTSTVYLGASNTLALDGALPDLVAGMWQGELPFFVKLGRITGPNESSTDGEGANYLPAHPDRSYQMMNHPSLALSPKDNGYIIGKGQAVNEDGSSVTAPTGYANAWSMSGGTTGNLQLVNGVEYTPAPAGGYAYAGTLSFRASVTFPC